MREDTDLCGDCEYLYTGEEGFDPPRYGYCLSYGVELEWAGDVVEMECVVATMMEGDEARDFFRYPECMEDFR